LEVATGLIDAGGCVAGGAGAGIVCCCLGLRNAELAVDIDIGIDMGILGTSGAEEVRPFAAGLLWVCKEAADAERGGGVGAMRTIWPARGVRMVSGSSSRPPPVPVPVDLDNGCGLFGTGAETDGDASEFAAEAPFLSLLLS
jgi:hypothetical protein